MTRYHNIKCAEKSKLLELVSHELNSSEIFIDRDPTNFRFILNHLRD